VCNLSNGTILNYLEWPITPISRSWEYSMPNTSTNTKTWSIKWRRFHWPWVTFSLDLKVTELLLMPSTYYVCSWRAIRLRYLTFLLHLQINMTILQEYGCTKFTAVTNNYFLSHVSMTKSCRLRYCYSRSVCLSVRHMLVLCQNDWRFRQTFSTNW